MPDDEPVRALLAQTALPCLPLDPLGDLACAIELYIGMRLEDRYLDVAAWARPMLARYIEIEIECFSREWRVPVRPEDLPCLTRAVLERLTRPALREPPGAAASDLPPPADGDFPLLA
jgi:hypothetical protein